MPANPSTYAVLAATCCADQHAAVFTAESIQTGCPTIKSVRPAAEAEVIKLKIASMESGNYAMVQVAEALAKSGMKLVPDVIATGTGGSGGTLVDVLLANLIRTNLLRPGEPGTVLPPGKG